MDLHEISEEEVIIPNKFIQDELNPSIWIKKGKDYIIKPEVRTKLLEIAKEFYEYLEIETPYEDIYFIGSMASYNWTSQSDIDLHLLFDYKKINKNTSLVTKYFDAKKSYWNDNHDIKIFGIDVELSCQEQGAPFYSKAVFSIRNNKWLNFPDKDKFSVDKQALRNKIVTIVNQIEKVEKTKDNEELLSKSRKVKDKIKKMRKSGLEKGGEFSIENLTFKYLRNNGYIGKLMKIKRDTMDKKLSLENE
jgi:hypothetical protein